MSDGTILDLNVIVMCMILSYTVGSNNAGNSWGSAYCTRVIALSTAVIFLSEIEKK